MNTEKELLIDVVYTKWYNKCIVCGALTDYLEPRFGYAVCEKHQHIPPVDITLPSTMNSILGYELSDPGLTPGGEAKILT